MKIITFLSGFVSILTSLYFFIKGIVKYLENNPQSKLRIFGRSIIGSLSSHLIVYMIAGIYYFFITQNFPNINKLFEFIPILIVGIAAIIVTPLFIVKDWYKRRNAFIIAEDNKLFEKDNKNFNQYAKTTSKIIAYEYIKSSLVSEVKLDGINNLRKSKHRLSKITKRYNILRFITWFALPLLALTMLIIGYPEYENKLDFVIIATIISIIFIFANCLVFYFDFKLEDGIVDQTDMMLKSHDKKYRKIIKKDKQKRKPKSA